MSDEDRMDALLRQLAAEEYNRPPEIVPREQMWEAIRQGSGKREAVRRREPGTGNREPCFRSTAGFRGGCTTPSRQRCCSRWVFSWADSLVRRQHSSSRREPPNLTR